MTAPSPLLFFWSWFRNAIWKLEYHEIGVGESEAELISRASSLTRASHSPPREFFDKEEEAATAARGMKL